MRTSLSFIRPLTSEAHLTPFCHLTQASPNLERKTTYLHDLLDLTSHEKKKSSQL